MNPTSRAAYAWHALSDAVYDMATSHAPLRDRLRAASSRIGVLGDGDMPDDDTRATLRAFRTRTGWAESSGEGTCPATLALLSDDEVSACATLLTLLHAELAAARER